MELQLAYLAMRAPKDGAEAETEAAEEEVVAACCLLVAMLLVLLVLLVAALALLPLAGFFTPCFCTPLNSLGCTRIDSLFLMCPSMAWS
jgi:hypothetical protein